MTSEGFFGELPANLKDWAEGKLYRLDQIRAGSVYPDVMEDGMKLILCQLLGLVDREREIIETYTQLRTLDFQRIRILDDLRQYRHHHILHKLEEKDK